MPGKKQRYLVLNNVGMLESIILPLVLFISESLVLNSNERKTEKIFYFKYMRMVLEVSVRDLIIIKDIRNYVKMGGICWSA